MHDTLGTVVLNWQRPDYTRDALASLRQQSIPPRIWVWNNNPEHRERPFDCDHRFDAPENRGCWVRWPLMHWMPCEYVFSWDDDWRMRDPEVLRDFLTFAKDLEGRGVYKYALGLRGRDLGRKCEYRWSRVSMFPKNHDRVSLVVGKFLFCRRDLLDDLRLGDRPGRGDDIVVSSLADECWILGGFRGRIRRMPVGPESLRSNEDEHYGHRADTMRKHLCPKLGLT